MSDKILVIGSSGTIGTDLVTILRAQGHDVRETTSRKENVVTIKEKERVFINLTTGEGIVDAFNGVSRAFLLSPPGYADQYGILATLIKEATKQKLDRVVLMTAMGANAVETAPFRQAELELERSGLTYNIIRPNWFLQNFHTFWLQGIREQRQIALPAGDALTSFIDARDIAEVAAVLLTDSANSPLANKDFDLSGPEAVSHADVAAAISHKIGAPVTYKNIAPETLKDGLLAAGLPGDYVDFMIMIFGFLKEGFNARTTDSVKLITGKAPRTLNDYANTFASRWA